MTREQAEKAITMCLDNAWSYLNDADMYVSNNRTDHLAIPIEFAMEEIGKAKIIYDKIEQSNSKILLSSKDGIYSHLTKMEKAVSLIELDGSDELADEMAEDLLLGGYSGFDYSLDLSTISNIIKKEIELKNTGKQGHDIRLASSYIDFDPITNEPKIQKPSVDFSKLIKPLHEIITGYPSSFNTY
ncbi:MAG: AbiV family abortive infection protein [Nitrosopumilus sp.]|nr:AbiV family abortive infection protein [Nitrosopumilus sp.]MDH5553873.1 AbiV family abortive infection protein [Nitrosopumilus sp.]